MLQDMILNGKDENIDELMFQLKVKNLPKNKKVVEKRSFDQEVQGNEVNKHDVEFTL